MAETMDMEPEEIGGDADSTSMYGTLAAFEIDKKIGKGQFSEVYRVVCKATGKVLALKKVQVCLLYYWQHSTVGNMSGNRCESYCRSRGWELDPGPVPYFRGD